MLYTLTRAYHNRLEKIFQPSGFLKVSFIVTGIRDRVFQIKPIDIQIVDNNYYTRFYQLDCNRSVTKQGNSNRVVTIKSDLPRLAANSYLPEGYLAL